MKIALLLGLLISGTQAAGSAGKDFSSQFTAIVELTSENYAEVAEAKLGFVLTFGAGPADEELGKVAQAVEGFARVGHVDTEKYPELLEILDLTAETAPAARGKLIGEGSEFADFESAQAAADAILANLPLDAATVLADESQFHPFLSSTLQGGQIPVVLLSDKMDVPKLFVKANLWMGELYRFAVFPNPHENVLKQFGAKKTPFLAAMIPQPVDEKDNQDGAQFQFAPQPYQRKQFGGMKFKNVVKYLATIQHELTQSGYFEKFSHFNVPGKKEKEKREKKASKGTMAKTEPLFEYTPETPNACSESKLGLCVIGLLDGSPPNVDLESQKELLREVQKMEINKGRALHFMWVDLACHPTFGEAFGFDLGMVPTAVIVSPKKAMWASFFGAFSAKKVNSFIHGVLGGKNRISPLPAHLNKKVPAILTDDDCAAIHEAMTPPAEDEDMDDIMAEMRAEEEAERAAAAKKAEEEKKDEPMDSELAAKHARAKKEMEKLNKMSQKGKKKKKKKKKSKGRGKADL